MKVIPLLYFKNGTTIQDCGTALTNYITVKIFYFFSGKSTHNQMIEHLWRDVCGGCLSLFYQLFQYLKVNHLLDADNDDHIWSLHYVYLPMINKHLQTWKNAWVHHPLSTEKNKTPMQLWVSGLHFTQFGQRILQNAQDTVTQVCTYLNSLLF